MKSVLSLRPSQFVLGVIEVANKVKKISSLSPKQLKKYMNDHKVPVVKASCGNLYIVDNHHFVRACWESNIKKVHVKIIGDLSSSSDKAFWQTMRKNNWTYLNDQFGRGPNNPLLLPVDVRGMADDPYRSLAWAAREAGVFNKVMTPFSEFKWANYFRKRVPLEMVRDNFPSALKRALKTSKLMAAKTLPGFKK